MRIDRLGPLALGLLLGFPTTALAENVLYCYDYAVSTDRMGPALASFGSSLTVTTTMDMTYCESSIAEGGWDLVIVAIQNSSYTTPNFNTFVSTGGRAILQDWTMDATRGVLFGATYSTTNQSSVTVTYPDFTTGLIKNPFALVNPGWGTFSMSMVPSSGATTAASFPSGAAAVIGNEGRTIINGFLTDTGDADATTFYVNEINYLLGISVDADGDGYTTSAGDCDDTNPDVHPGAEELCDGIDNDCDAEIDNDALDATTWYADEDLDLYGDPLVYTIACDAPEGTVSDGTDCDDTNPDVHPGAEESCNDIDDDCDGDIDERGATGETVWYRDSDGDLYTRRLSTTISCDPPPGYIALADALGTDCDDTDSSVHPGAEELCNDVDDDCDDDIDEDATDATTWYADDDKDGYANPDVTLIDCDRPTGFLTAAESLGDDCDDTDASVHAGATEYCNGIDDDCDGWVDEDSAVDASTWYADADHDGWADSDVAYVSCTAPKGYIAMTSSEDCDDLNDAVYPGATEYCNGIDDDCDALIDEPGAVGEQDFILDADGDSYGLPDTLVTDCEAPKGYIDTDSSLGTDCDDSQAAIHPGATETCNDVDDDCDTLIDEAGAVGETTWYRDSDEDLYGTLSDTIDACDPPTGYVEESLDGFDCDDSRADVHPGAPEKDCTDPTDYNCDGSTGYADLDLDAWAACEDCDDNNAAVNPDATEACNGIDDDCDLEIDEAGALGEVTWYADRDGDLYTDDLDLITSCDAPSDYLPDDESLGTDCDDQDPLVHPGADEIADDGIDQDCDGEDLSSPEDTGDTKGKYGGGGGLGCAVQAAPAQSGLLLSILAGLSALLGRRRATRSSRPSPQSR